MHRIRVKLAVLAVLTAFAGSLAGSATASARTSGPLPSPAGWDHG